MPPTRNGRNIGPRHRSRLRWHPSSEVADATKKFLLVEASVKRHRRRYMKDSGVELAAFLASP